MPQWKSPDFRRAKNIPNARKSGDFRYQIKRVRTMAQPTDEHFEIVPDAENLPAWTEIAPGRFMPRRVRGSAHGRALG